MKHTTFLALALALAALGCNDSAPNGSAPDSGADTDATTAEATDAATDDAAVDEGMPDATVVPAADAGADASSHDAAVDVPLDAGADGAVDPSDAAILDDAQTPPLDCDQACSVHAECVVSATDATCVCDSGYEGDGIACTDVDECDRGTDTCSPYAWCTNTPGAYECECYMGSNGDGFDCVDVDQCAAETDTCSANATCTNTFGLYLCECFEGFLGNGEVCADVDECEEQLDTCDAHARCIDEDGGYDCECDEGYVGDGFSCDDVNECEQGSSSCDPLTSCVDLGGGYECTACPAGFAGTGGTTCIPQLVGLAPSSGRLSPAFAPSTLDYTLTTGLDATIFHVVPSAPAGATITVDGASVTSGAASTSVALPAVGSTASRTITVAASNGATREYTLAIERNYVERAYVKASNAERYDAFGSAFAVDGDVMVVGASSEDGAATTIDGNQASNGASQSGAAYVFRRVAGAWQQQAYLKASNAQGSNNGSGALGDAFGAAVAVSGDRIVVGAPWEDSAAVGVNGAQSDNGASDSGAAYVFKFDGTKWQQEAYLKASNTSAGDSFGFAVAIAGDVIVVGADLEDGNVGGVNVGGFDEGAINAGAAYVYRYVSGQWQQEAYLKARHPDVQDRFGVSVAVDQDVVLVGANGEDSGFGGVNAEEQDESAPGSGAAYVFRRVAGTWQQEAYLKAAHPGSESGGVDGYGDFFGIRVALHDDVALIGAPYEASAASGVDGDQTDDSQLAAGAAYVFRHGVGGWEQEAYLKASHPDGRPEGQSIANGDLFGLGIALGTDRIVVGAPGEDSAARRVNGDPLDDSAPGAGAVYVFERGGSGWSQVAYLKSSNADGPAVEFESTGDELGRFVGLSGKRVFATAYGEDANVTGVHTTSSFDNSLSYSGAVYVFE